MKYRTRLRIEQLEDRITPSSFGQPWPNPSQLTVSFVPDNTSINGAPSNLFATLDKIAPTATWQQTILKALQAWVPTTNVNFVVVNDSGAPLGANGSVQGDPRFGDIRIGMAPLPANLVATTAPFSWTGSTYSGDIILNSSYAFSLGGATGYDLYTVAMHEAGHALGLPDNTTDINSAMYANYTGPLAGPDSLDISNIQSLYGVRASESSNNTRATATPIGNTASQLGFNADLSSPGDVDFYKIQSPLLDLGLASLSVTISAVDRSLLVPTVSIYNAAGRLLATQSASAAYTGTVSITIPSPGLLATYYIEVSHATSDAFSTGYYWGDITYKSILGEILTGVVGGLVDGVVNTLFHTNTSTSSASPLPLAFGNASDQRFSYLYQANLVYGGDADYYQFTVPTVSSSTGAYALDAIVWQTAPGALAPTLHFFDSSGNPIATQVMSDTSSDFSLQLLGVTPGQKLYVEVAGQTTSGPTSTGFYVLGIKFNQTPETVAPAMGSNTLPLATSTDTGILAMNQNGVFYFELGAEGGNSTITMTVFDADGNEVASLSTLTGAAPRTGAFYLPAGTYSIVYRIASTSGSYAPATYWVSGEILSDPIGPYYSGATGSAPPPTSSSTTSPAGGSSTATISSTKTFAASGAAVSISTRSGSTSVPIPAAGTSQTYTFTTSVGTTTVTLSSDYNGNVTLTLTTPSTNTITDNVTTSGSTSTETLTTSDGIQVVIRTPITTPSPTYSGSSPSTPPPYYY
jgi:predicted Zn-dependent protease